MEPRNIGIDEMNDSLAWQRDELNFHFTPVAEIVKEFNRYNRRPQIFIADPRLGAMKMSGAFNVHDPEGFLKVLQSTIARVIVIRHDPPDETVELTLRR